MKENINRKKWIGKGYHENDNIIYELINDNGKVKEYNYDELIFEGELLKGKRNGKGKEYMYGEPIFEGEYLNGKKWDGRFKDYISKGELVREGNYLNGNKIYLNYY